MRFFDHPDGNRYAVTDATHIGLVFDRPSGAVKRIFNPTYQQELDWHFVGPDEFMIRVPKTEYGVSVHPDSMTLDDVARIAAVFNS